MPERTKVLVVESDPRAAQAIARTLQSDGLAVVSAQDAPGAISAARREQPDVVVLNSKLAGGGGLVALQRIRSNVYTANIPVVALLTRGGGKERELLISAGAQECIPLAEDGSGLVEAVKRNCLESLDFTQAPAEVIQAAERMSDVQASGLLDTPPAESFDRITRLAADLLGVPTALMSIVDRDRQFFKSQVGLKLPWTDQRQSRLSHSFCQWVVSGREPLVIGDAREHAVLGKNLAVRDLGVVAYAGFPIAGRTGQLIGSFCAIDPAPRAWTEGQLATLADLAQVSEVYALQANEAPGAMPEMQPERATVLAARALLAAANVLQRHAATISPEDRAALAGICRTQAERVLALAEGPQGV